MTDQIPDYELRGLHECARQLRAIASTLLVHAPSASVRADALATEVQLRIKRLEQF